MEEVNIVNLKPTAWDGEDMIEGIKELLKQYSYKHDHAHTTTGILSVTDKFARLILNKISPPLAEERIARRKARQIGI